MREQKYKDILKEYEENERELSSKKEKLSMTRELKFKELQEHLIEEEEDKALKLSVTREMKFSDILSNEDDNQEDFIDEEDSESEDVPEEIEEILEAARLKEAAKKKNFKVKEASNEELKSPKSTDEDIYLTTSFKPFTKKFRFRKVFKVLFILIILGGLIGSFTYFVALPIYHKFLDSMPKMIFDHTVDYIDKNIENFIDTVFADEDIYYSDFNFKLDTNIDTLDILSNYTYGYRVAVNPSEKLYEDFLYVKENNDKYGIYYMESNLKKYITLTGSSSYFEMGDLNEDDKDYYNVMSQYLEDMTLSKEEVKYVINKELSIVKELLEEDLISSQKDELEVNGKTIKVVKNSFTVEKKDAERLSKKYYELVKEDKKLVKFLAELDELEENEYLDQLEEELTGEIEDDYKLIINIYTVNGTEFAGFDVEENGFRVLYLYINENKEFDFYINLTENEDCLKGNDCVASDREIYELDGRQIDKTYEVNIKYNSIKYATLNVDSFNLDKVKFDYNIFIEDKIIKGDILLFLDNEKGQYDIDLSVKIDGQYINLKLFFGLKPTDTIAFVDEDKVVKYTDDLYEKEWNEFGLMLEEQGLDDGFILWYMINYKPEEFISEIISEFEYFDDNVLDEVQSM